MTLRSLTAAQLTPILAAALAIGGAPAALVATAPAIAALLLELLDLVEGGADLPALVQARMPDDEGLVLRVLEQLRAQQAIS